MKKILIVEDNALNRKLFRDLLHAHGYETLESECGLKAIEIARRENPDLVILDIQLPHVSGLEVMECIKSDPVLKDTPVVAITAFAMKRDEHEIRESGVKAYLPKPISIDRFMTTIRDIFVPIIPAAQGII